MQIYVGDELGFTPGHQQVDWQAIRHFAKQVITKPLPKSMSAQAATQAAIQQEWRDASGNFSAGIIASPAKESQNALAILNNNHFLGGAGKLFNGTSMNHLFNYWNEYE